MSFTLTAPPNTPASPIIQSTTPLPKTQPIPIPARKTHHSDTPFCAIPPHLLPADPRPSLIHHGRENTTSFTTLWSFKRDIAISRSEDLITAPHRLAPPCWVGILGAGPSEATQQRQREMVMRDVVVVKARKDRIGAARWAWVCEQQPKEEWEQREEKRIEARKEEARKWRRKSEALRMHAQKEGMRKGRRMLESVEREVDKVVGRVECGVAEGDGRCSRREDVVEGEGDGDEGFSVW
ncbi:hypothetical protein E8E13_001160 [Curvularia kusanoi]|uniref:Uncharacterized protein n=1 Tax=Curvularia kusanoi TaxID=90978 RepID=A0A9P4W820_CURKU|nr:hypothetical protein E8E13_001160 [Curvularia kusanoi]